MAVYTMADVPTVFERLMQEIDKAVLEGCRRGSRYAQKLAITKYMEGAAKGAKSGRDRLTNPPNPPPGPLKKRSGDLARAVDIVEPKLLGDTVLVGLKVDLAKAPYGRIHEKGGYAGRGRSVRIPARPYLRPALNDSVHVIQSMIAERLGIIARKF